MPLDSILERLAAGERAPGAGTAAALTVAFAASLVAMAARSSGDAWNDANGTAAQALLLKHRAVPLAATDAEAWQAASEALQAATAADGADAGGARLEQVLERAAAVPLEVSELAADGVWKN